MLLGLFAFTWFGVLMGMLIRSSDAVQGIGFAVMLPLSFLAGTFVPISGMKLVPRAIAEWDALSALVAAVRHVWRCLRPRLLGPIRRPGWTGLDTSQGPRRCRGPDRAKVLSRPSRSPGDRLRWHPRDRTYPSAVRSFPAFPCPPGRSPGLPSLRHPHHAGCGSLLRRKAPSPVRDPPGCRSAEPCPAGHPARSAVVPRTQPGSPCRRSDRSSGLRREAPRRRDRSLRLGPRSAHGWCDLRRPSRHPSDQSLAQPHSPPSVVLRSWQPIPSHPIRCQRDERGDPPPFERTGIGQPTVAGPRPLSGCGDIDNTFNDRFPETVLASAKNIGRSTGVVHGQASGGGGAGRSDARFWLR